MLIFQTSKDLFLFADLIFNFGQDFIVLLEQDGEFLGELFWMDTI